MALTYNISITFLRAENLPIADIPSLSSDPYVSATLETESSVVNKDYSPPLRFRTQTQRCTTNPTWDCVWDVGNVPRPGTKLHVQMMDEDYGDHDDRLGHVTIDFERLARWEGEKVVNEEWYPLRKKGASKKAAVLRLCAAGASAAGECVGGEGTKAKAKARVLVRIEVKGETKLEKPYPRAFTMGPNYWTKHYSPLIGKVIHSKDDQKASVFSFEANKLQLTGPVPVELSHMFFGFAPFVTDYFTRHGLRGRLLNRALHSQYNNLYAYDANTKCGFIKDGGGIALARCFLDMVHWSEGHRVFTYIITLDGEWRFTETGTEFAIDLLSKHGLHSDVSKVIAYSGEFFVQRLGGPDKHDTSSSPHTHTHNHTHDHDHDHYENSNPSDFELVIDNDSGTYRPNKSFLPLLASWLHSNLRGLGSVKTYDCFDEDLGKFKKERKEAKHADGTVMMFRQRSMGSSGSISSSDEEELDTGREGNAFKRMKEKIIMSGWSNAWGPGGLDGK